MRRMAFRILCPDNGVMSGALEYTLTKGYYFSGPALAAKLLSASQPDNSASATEPAANNHQPKNLRHKKHTTAGIR